MKFWIGFILGIGATWWTIILIENWRVHQQLKRKRMVDSMTQPSSTLHEIIHDNWWRPKRKDAGHHDKDTTEKTDKS